MSWDDRWMDLCGLLATWSKDLGTKTSAVIVDDRNVLLSIGWNGFPRGVNDDADDRKKRPEKLDWTEHAERNAIYNAAAKGIALLESRMYIPWYPCAACSRGIIQSGISQLVVVEPNWNCERWGNDFSVSKVMLQESNISVRFYGKL
jgi:dCMP deaminase